MKIKSTHSPWHYASAFQRHTGIIPLSLCLLAGTTFTTLPVYATAVNEPAQLQSKVHDENRTIQGLVVDEKDGTPLIGVNITLIPMGGGEFYKRNLNRR